MPTLLDSYLTAIERPSANQRTPLAKSINDGLFGDQDDLLTRAARSRYTSGSVNDNLLLADKRAREERAAELADRGIFSELVAGVKRGFDQEMALIDGAQAVGQDLVGMDPSENIKEYTRAMREAQLNNPKSVNRVEDIDNIGEALLWGSGMLGEQLPFLATLALSGGIGRLAAEGTLKYGIKKTLSEAAKRRGLQAGTAAGVVGPSIALGAGEAGGEQIETTGGLVSSELAAGTGLVVGALDSVTPLWIASRFGLTPGLTRNLAGEITRQAGMRGMLKAGGSIALSEGTTELLQEVALMSARKVYDENFEILSPEGKSRMLNAFAAGATVGGSLGMGTNMLLPAAVDQTDPETGVSASDIVDEELADAPGIADSDTPGPVDSPAPDGPAPTDPIVQEATPEAPVPPQEAIPEDEAVAPEITDLEPDAPGIRNEEVLRQKQQQELAGKLRELAPTIDDEKIEIIADMMTRGPQEREQAYDLLENYDVPLEFYGFAHARPPIMPETQQEEVVDAPLPDAGPAPVDTTAADIDRIFSELGVGQDTQVETVGPPQPEGTQIAEDEPSLVNLLRQQQVALRSEIEGDLPAEPSQLTSEAEAAIKAFQDNAAAQGMPGADTAVAMLRRVFADPISALVGVGRRFDSPGFKPVSAGGYANKDLAKTLTMKVQRSFGSVDLGPRGARPAVWQAMQQMQPGDFVVATGRAPKELVDAVVTQMRAWQREYAPDMKLVLISRKSAERGVYGSARMTEDGAVIYIDFDHNTLNFVTKSRKAYHQVNTMYTVAHEMGHALANWNLLQADDTTRAAVAEDYRQYVNKHLQQKSVTVDVGRGRFDILYPIMRKAKRQDITGKPLAERGSPFRLSSDWIYYMLDPHEWMADNLALHLTGVNKQADVAISPITDKFFSRMANQMRRIYQRAMKWAGIQQEETALGTKLALALEERRLARRLGEIERITGEPPTIIQRDEELANRSVPASEEETLESMLTQERLTHRILSRIRPKNKVNKARIRQELKAIKATKAELQAAEFAMQGLVEGEFTWNDFVSRLESMFMPLEPMRVEMYSQWGLDNTFNISQQIASGPLDQVWERLVNFGEAGNLLPPEQQRLMRVNGRYMTASPEGQKIVLAENEKFIRRVVRRASARTLMDRGDAIEAVMGKGAEARTIVWRSGLLNETENHFHDPHYVGHTRVLDAGTRRWVLEVQSDLAQQTGSFIPTVESAVSEVQLGAAVRHMERLQALSQAVGSWTQETNPESIIGQLDALRNMLNGFGDWGGIETKNGEIFHQGDLLGIAHDGVVASMANIDGLQATYRRTRQIDWEEVRNLNNGLDIMATNLEGYITELQPTDEAMRTGGELQLPRIHERLIRETIRDAQEQGIFKVMLPTSETLWYTEEWGTGYADIDHITDALRKGKEPRLGDVETFLISTQGYSDRGEAQQFVKELQAMQADGKNVRRYLLNAEAERSSSNGANSILSVMRNHDKLLRWVGKKYDVRPTVDAQGNTWLEVVAPRRTPQQRIPVFANRTVSAMEETRKASAAAAHEARKTNSNAPSRQQLDAEQDQYAWYTKWAESLTQLIKKNLHVPGMVNYGEAVDEWSSMRMTWMGRANDRVGDWRKLGRSQAQRLGGFMQALTVRHQDAWPTRDELLELTREFGLTKDTYQVYRDIRSDFSAVLDSLEEAMYADIEATYTNPMQIDSEKAKVKEEVDAMRGRPYFPLARFGQHTVVVKQGGKTIRMEAFESEREQKKRFGELKRQYDNSAASVRMDYLSTEVMQFRGMPTQFLRQIRGRLNLTESQQAELDQLLVEHAPAASFRKHFTRRDITPGFDRDAQRAYADYFFHGANHIARMHYGDRMQKAMQQVSRSAEEMAGRHGVDLTKRRKMHEWLNVHYDYIMRPENDWAGLRAAGFLWYLGFNVKSALVNLTQVPLVTTPYLAARFGDARSIKMLTGTLRNLPGSMMHNTEGIKAEEEWALKRAIQEGWIDESNAAELAGMADGGMMRGKHAELVRRTQEAAAYLFHQAERANRRITMLAAYRLAMRDPQNKYVLEIADANPQQIARMSMESGGQITRDQAKAFLVAKDAVRTTQYEYARWNRPKFMRGKASVVFLFYQYLQNTLHFAGNDPGKWRFLGTLLATAGIMGLPGAEDADALVRIISRNVTGDDLSFKKWAREELAQLTDKPDLFLHGLSRYTMGLGNELTGMPIPNLDLSGSLSMGRILPGLAEFGTEGRFEDKFMRAATDVGGAAYSIPLSIMQAAYDDQNPDSFKRWERAMPSALKSLSAAYRYANEEREVTRTNATVIEFDPDNSQHNAEIAARALGFPITRLNQTWDLMRAQKDQATFYAVRKEILMRALDFARERGDPEDRKEAMQAIKRYNAEVRKAGHPALTITGKSISKSMRARIRRRRLLEAGLPAAKRERSLYRATAEQFPEVGR